jgi:CheY-like chemotaxis protein
MSSEPDGWSRRPPIPQDVPEGGNAVATVTPRSHRQGSKTILVADDDDVIRNSICMVLADDDFDVIAARDGREVLRELRAQPPRVLLLDLMMPEVSGYEVYNALRDDPTLLDEHKLVIVTAADPRPQDFPLADAILYKPFDIDTLLETVERLAT